MFAGEVAGAPPEDEQPVMGQAEEAAATPPADSPSSLASTTAEENATSPTGEPTLSPIIANTEDDKTASPPEFPSSLPPSLAEENATSPTGMSTSAPLCPPANSAEAPTSAAITDDAPYGVEVTGHMVSIHEPASSPDISFNVQVSPSACTL